MELINKSKKIIEITQTDNKLSLPLIELTKMLFNVETYMSYSNALSFYLNMSYAILTLEFCRSAIMEFEINMS
jgi:hypothetical protein